MPFQQRQRRCIATFSGNNAGGSTKVYDKNQKEGRSFLNETTRGLSGSKAFGSDSSPAQLWEEMSTETRELASSIIDGNRSIGADNRCHHSHTAKTGATSPNSVHPRVAISRAITLMESKHPAKKKQGDLLLTYLLSLSSPNESDNVSTEGHEPLSFSTPALRVGFAGPPGAGKSSLIESFSLKLLEQDPNLKLAVVCIDPSSNISGGSILGDKTRMTQLSRETDRALVRPSCNSGVLGGLAAYTDDVVRLLGCAGYPLVLVETVGLGQSEIEAAQSVDVLVLLVPPSGGDELQGVKKGIVEMANILAVTKTDGDLRAAAERTAADYKGAIRVLHQSNSNTYNSINSSDCTEENTKRWIPPVVKTSSITEHGLDDLWKAILRYQNYLFETKKWNDKRQEQAKYWMWKQFGRMIQVKMETDPILRKKANLLEQKMLEGLLTPRVAAQLLQDEVFGFTK